MRAPSYFDLRGNVEAMEDLVAAGRSQSFGYDGLSRLSSATGAYGAQAFTYDGVGNRLSQTVTPPGGSASTDRYSYPASSHRLSAIAGANPATFGYDDTGNTTARGSLTLSYNAAGRAAGVGAVGSIYNAAGQRVKKLGAETLVFHYGAQGQLIAETDATGRIRREYVYLDGLPLALIAHTRRVGRAPEGKGPPAGRGPPSHARIPDQAVTIEVKTYYFHTDHLGTPQRLTDANQAVAWAATYQPFGDVSLDTALVEQPLRFPGQYFDAETGVHQNWHRDYDPSIGRYLQSDPIGLAGGLNTYAYVGGNPISTIDPTGLESPTVTLNHFCNCPPKNDSQCESSGSAGSAGSGGGGGGGEALDYARAGAAGGAVLAGVPATILAGQVAAHSPGVLAAFAMSDAVMAGVVAGGVGAVVTAGAAVGLYYLGQSLPPGGGLQTCGC